MTEQLKDNETLPTAEMLAAGLAVLDRHHVDAYGDVKLTIIREIWTAMSALRRASL